MAGYTLKEKSQKYDEDKKSLDDLSWLQLLLLRSLGLLGLPGRPLDFWASRLLRIFTHSCNLFITSMYGCSVARSLMLSGRADVQVISEFVGLCGVSTRFLVVHRNRHHVADVIQTVRDLWLELRDDFQGQTNVRRFIKKSDLVRHFYIAILVVMLLFYVSWSQLFSAERSLPYAFYGPVKPSSDWFNIALVCQIIGMIVICSAALAVDTATMFLVMFACGLLCSLRDRLEKLAETKDATKLRCEIVRCIAYHQKIIKFCRQVEKFTRLLFMVQLVSTTYNMSFIGLTLVGKDPGKFKSSTVLIIYLIQLFMCQWAPDLLVTESLSLARSAYFFPFTNNDGKKIGQFIQIVIMRCQRSIQLTAGGYINLSMECFGSMMTNAVSLFTVLRSMN